VSGVTEASDERQNPRVADSWGRGATGSPRASGSHEQRRDRPCRIASVRSRAAGERKHAPGQLAWCRRAAAFGDSDSRLSDCSCSSISRAAVRMVAPR
jgi:hypothetical protein